MHYPRVSQTWLCEAAHHAVKAYLDRWTDAEFYEVYKVLQDEHTGIMVHVAGRENTVIIAFTGTEPTDYRDWVTNLSIKGTPCELLKGKVHHGFLKSYRTVHVQICNIVCDYLGRHPQAEVLCVGHSLGGALAQLCHAEVKLYADKVSSVTLGAPAMFDKDAARYFKQTCGDTSYRIVNGSDIVPRIAQLVGWKHATPMIYASRSGKLRYGVDWWFTWKDRVKHGVFDWDWEPDGLHYHDWKEYLRVICDVQEGDTVTLIENL